MKQIKQNALDFLIDIKQNNNREWFLENKQRYLDIKKELESFNDDWFAELSSFDESLQNFGEKPYLFRIYRDARFSRGRPYKTNYGLYIAQGGRKYLHSRGGYYLNIEPDNFILFGGVWRAEPWLLQKIRDDINNDSSTLRKILNNKELKKYFSFDGEQLKTYPRGYSKDHPDIDLLKYKDFYLIHKFSKKDILSPDFFNKLTKLSKLLLPLNNYINSMQKK